MHSFVGIVACSPGLGGGAVVAKGVIPHLEANHLAVWPWPGQETNIVLSKKKMAHVKGCFRKWLQLLPTMMLLLTIIMIMVTMMMKGL